MLPRLSRFNVLDDMFNDSVFTKSQIMKTDIKEKGENYILEIDLPGYKKEDITMELSDGYLNIEATISNEEDNSDKQSNYIHKERFYGKCSRSFYVGDNITDKDINASFKNGILCVIFPKDVTDKIKDKKYIEIND